AYLVADSWVANLRGSVVAGFACGMDCRAAGARTDGDDDVADAPARQHHRAGCATAPCGSLRPRAACLGRSALGTSQPGAGSLASAPLFPCAFAAPVSDCFVARIGVDRIRVLEPADRRIRRSVLHDACGATCPCRGRRGLDVRLVARQWLA